MLGNSRLKALSALFVLAASVAGCASSADYSPFLRAEPAADSVLVRAPRNLRLFYEALPDVPKSSLTLSGPGGDYDLRGFHTMGSDDLMIEITNPSIPDGDYVVDWSAVVGEDSTVYEGSYRFSVVTDR
ncbi:MAG: copper resistance protein CopC [Gammaproteobacteria bacterium]|nr:copper resistance protein CopC [Gammaproteobacteria bacterium]